MPVKEALAEMKAHVKQIEKAANDAFELAQHHQTKTDVMGNGLRMLKDKS